jgi:hypothetical protein
MLRLLCMDRNVDGGADAIGHALLASQNAYKVCLSLEQTRERAVEDAIGLDGQRIRAAPKAPLRKRPTPFPSAVHRSFFQS